MTIDTDAEIARLRAVIADLEASRDAKEYAPQAAPVVLAHRIDQSAMRYSLESLGARSHDELLEKVIAALDEIQTHLTK